LGEKKKEKKKKGWGGEMGGCACYFFACYTTHPGEGGGGGVGVFKFQCMLYEKHGHYVNRIRQNYEIHSILCKIKQIIQHVFKNSVNLLVA